MLRPPRMPIPDVMRRRASAPLVALLALSALVATAPGAAPALAAAPRRAQRPAAPAVPAGLPTHLGIGLAAGPSDDGIYGWMPDSGIPFDYAYQYLAGGVNTGNSWRYWN